MSDTEDSIRLEERLPLSERQFSMIKSVMDEALPIVLLLFGLLILFQFVIPVTPGLKTWIHIAGWGVAVFFTVRLAVEYRLRDPDENFWRNHWVDLLMAIPLLGLLQEARLAKLAEETIGISTTGRELAAMSTLRNSRTAAKITKIIQILRRTFKPG